MQESHHQAIRSQSAYFPLAPRPVPEVTRRLASDRVGHFAAAPATHHSEPVPRQKENRIGSF